MTYVIDTHALLWFLDGNQRLGMNAKTILSDPNASLVLPAIAYAEACWICETGRKVSLPLSKLVSHVNRDPRITITPVNRSVVERSNSLVSINEMHDRQIVATVLLIKDAGTDASLLSIDQNIVDSGLVPMVW